MKSLEYGAFAERIYEGAFSNQVPSQGHFEITFKCPLKCVFCYCTCYTSPEHTKNELSTLEIKKILAEAADNGCLWITFSGGDPFVRPDFREIYDYSIELGLIPTILCSGLLLTDEWLAHLQVQRPLKIELPLYGANKLDYEKVAGRTNVFERAVENIRRMVHAGLPVRLKSKITSLNLERADELKNFIEQELGLEFNPFYQLYPRLDKTTDHLQYRLSPLQVRKLEEKYGYTGCDSSSESAHEEIGNPKLFRCAAGVNSFYVNPYGQMNFCTYVRQSSYDLRTGSLLEGMKQLRADLLELTYPEGSSCKTCSIQSSCENCPGHAVLETGKLDGKSEYLCEVNHTLREKPWVMPAE